MNKSYTFEGDLTNNVQNNSAALGEKYLRKYKSIAHWKQMWNWSFLILTNYIMYVKEGYQQL